MRKNCVLRINPVRMAAYARMTNGRKADDWYSIVLVWIVNPKLLRSRLEISPSGEDDWYSIVLVWIANPKLLRSRLEISTNKGARTGFHRIVIARPGSCEPKQSDLRNEIASCLAMTIFLISVIGSLYR